MSAPVKVDICQLPHGEGLALPAYQSADAAGLDLLAAVPADTPLILPPGKYAMVPTTSDIGPCHAGGTLGRTCSAAVASARAAPMA